MNRLKNIWKPLVLVIVVLFLAVNSCAIITYPN